MGNLHDMERQYKLLASARRLAILRELKHGKHATVGDLARAIGLSFRSTSKHLTLLERAGVLRRVQRSTSVFYRLSLEQPEILKSALRML